MRGWGLLAALVLGGCAAAAPGPEPDASGVESVEDLLQIHREVDDQAAARPGGANGTAPAAGGLLEACYACPEGGQPWWQPATAAARCPRCRGRCTPTLTGVESRPRTEVASATSDSGQR